ncbi:REP element-mobilizing transposase RayT [Rhodopirellula rubra]|uniref:REP element-mobilizing transposase RayT n=1 Tax=Aporhodopirellula rubra TaxID=980271 RepID=A0A7W5DY00_9BACT|nr:IS200/IS605 family transposase [Aporhodopirellula rubra]MBB3206609.1 REP element-mobilizing transposase RayT [Aporhodopirellula rubra]
MGQSLVQIYVHIVFSTKGRKPFLKSDVQRERLHAYLSGICKNQNSPAIVIGGVEDHVHLLCRLGKTIEIAKLARNLKSDSSEWVKKDLSIKNFYWQTGYGAFSVSPSHIAALTKYIENQGEHHRKESFQIEFRRLCAKYGVEIDERYVWD